MNAVPTDPFNVTHVSNKGEQLARTEREILISIAQLLEEVLAVQRHLLSAVSALNQGSALLATNEPRESRSSLEVKTSTRGVDITSKVYAQSDIEPLPSAAVDAYFEALAQVQARLNGGTQ